MYKQNRNVNQSLSPLRQKYFCVINYKSQRHLNHTKEVGLQNTNASHDFHKSSIILQHYNGEKRQYSIWLFSVQCFAWVLDELNDRKVRWNLRLPNRSNAIGCTFMHHVKWNSTFIRFVVYSSCVRAFVELYERCNRLDALRYAWQLAYPNVPSRGRGGWLSHKTSTADIKKICYCNWHNLVFFSSI
jgi:hypothetical protein